MDKNTTPNTPEQKTEVLPLKLDVRVRPITPDGNLIGFASVTINDAFAINGLRVCTGEHGIFANMPSRQDSNGEYRDIAFPITAAAREQLQSAVVAAYSREMVKLQEMLDSNKDALSVAAERPAGEKPSVKDALNSGAERAAAGAAPKDPSPKQAPVR